MANNDKKQNADKTTMKPVAEIYVSSIIAALHQNAIKKCQSKLGDKFRIRNSAINDDGDKSTLESAGEQIISIIPTEAAAKNNENVIKKDAIGVLKEYVSWFVGPDLAKDVNNSTVKSLTEAPGADAKLKQEDKKEEEKKDEDKENDKDLKESFKPFMSFSQFLREAEDDSDFGKEDDVQSPKEDDEDGFGKNPEDGKPEEKDKNKESDKKEIDKKEDIAKEDKKEDDIDEAIESQLGYYITYDMKVEGVKKRKIEDSVHTLSKSLLRYFGNFFDDLKITASGIFGGGDSFTIKDVKSNIRKAFGPINPREIVDNVEDRLNKKFAGSGHVEVKVQDTQTLLSDIGPALKNQEKIDGVNYESKINGSKYALFIKIDQDDPKKEIVNRGSIAKIVIASIPGIYKKLASWITKDDVICIKNYRDIHNQTSKIRALYNSVPTINELVTIIQKAANANAAISAIENKIDKTIRKNKLRKDCARANECAKVWEDFCKTNKTKERAEKLKNVTGDEKDKFFDSFKDAYNKAYNKTEDKNLKESCSFIFNIPSFKKQLLDMICESFVFEEDDKQDKEKKDSPKIDPKALEKSCMLALKTQSGKDLSNSKILCASKDDIKKTLQEYDLQKFDQAFGEYKNGILFAEVGNTLLEAVANALIKDCIMDILFEGDKENADDSKINAELLYTIFSSKLDDAGVTDYLDKMIEFDIKKYEKKPAKTDSSTEKDDIKQTTNNDNTINNEDDFGKDVDTLNESFIYEDNEKAIVPIDNIRNTLHSNMFDLQSKGGKSPSPIVAVGTASQIISFLKDHSLGTSSDYDKLGNDNAMLVCVKRHTDININDNTFKFGGSAGEKYVTLESVTQIFEKIANKFEYALGDIVEINGKPSKIKVNSDIFNCKPDKLLNCQMAKVPKSKNHICNVSIYATALNENQTTSDNAQNNELDNSVSNDSTNQLIDNTISNKKKAYVLPFGKDFIIGQEDSSSQTNDKDNDNTSNDGDDHNMSDYSDNNASDLYIIPLKKMAFDDPESTNNNLIN